MPSWNHTFSLICKAVIFIPRKLPPTHVSFSILLASILYERLNIYSLKKMSTTQSRHDKFIKITRRGLYYFAKNETRVDERCITYYSFYIIINEDDAKCFGSGIRTHIDKKADYDLWLHISNLIHPVDISSRRHPTTNQLQPSAIRKTHNRWMLSFKEQLTCHRKGYFTQRKWFVGWLNFFF